MRYRVELADEAWKKIRDRASYIAKQSKAPEVAARWLARILEATDALETLPLRHRRAIEDAFFEDEVRVMNVGGFLLFYTVNEASKVVHVVNARHERQLPLDHTPDG